MWNSSATFFVKGGDVGFADREKRLFDCLNAAENEKNGREGSSLNPTSNRYEGMDVEVPSRKRRRAETKQFRGKESIFKKPGDPPPKFKIRDIPDHHRNPHKWIRYSLGDVSPEDMSDKCNTATALSFLREIQLRKEQPANQEMDCDCTDTAPVVFKRPMHKNTALTSFDDGNYTPPVPAAADKAVFKSSKMVMPEYVVGRDKKERKLRSNSPSSNYDKSKEIKLDHLQYEDDPE